MTKHNRKRSAADGIPNRLSSRPRDPRGYVIGFTQYVSPDGTPDFRVMDDERVARALQHRLCSICGEPLGKYIFFIGGPKCVEYGLFYDPPMHHECAVHALQTCPHLARAKVRYVVGEMDAVKCEWFGLMQGKRFHFGRTDKGIIVIRAELPWLSVERWRDGRIEHENGK